MTDFRIVRLQVQRSPAKVGKAPMRFYDPGSLVSVSTIEAGPLGVRGISDEGEMLLDVHHRQHPQSRDPKAVAGILFMGTGDYTTLRGRYGNHVVDGIAGETMLLEAPDGLAGREMPETVTVKTAAGPLELHGVRVADPCVEFSRFCLGRAATPIVDDTVKQTLIDLSGGARGYRSIARTHGTISIGDIVTI